MKQKKPSEVKYILLSKNTAWINKRGKPHKEVNMLSSEGCATGAKGRKHLTHHIMAVLEDLLSDKHHFILQSSEGDGIKISGNDNMTRCVMFVRSGKIQIFCLKAKRPEAIYLLEEAKINSKKINIRSMTKTEYVYVDFDDDQSIKPSDIATFIRLLPPSTACNCGKHIVNLSSRTAEKTAVA